jgi:hypothetical protein
VRNLKLSASRDVALPAPRGATFPSHPGERGGGGAGGCDVMGAGPTFFLKGVEGHITSHGGGGGQTPPWCRHMSYPWCPDALLNKYFSYSCDCEQPP